MTKAELNGLLARNPQLSISENQASGLLSRPGNKPKRTNALGTTSQGTDEGVARPFVRFIGYRVRPCDPDNFPRSCKDLLDGLRHAQLISGDEPWRIIFQTEQVKVRAASEERTEIEIITPL
jgi:hypothetical protein